jgi:signal transduction histidine kinase
MKSDELVGSETSFIDLPPNSTQRAIGVVVVFALAAGFAVTAFFSTTRMPEITAFIPIVAAMIFLNDFITSILLFGQYSFTGSKAILMLASGYLFTALIIIPYTLTFPGAFAPTGLLGAGIQSTAWLYIFWHFGYPASVAAYASYKGAGSSGNVREGSPSAAIRRAVFIVVAVVCTLAWLATAGKNYLPPLFVDVTHTGPLSPYVLALDGLVSVFALAMLWARRRSLLDLCLMIVMCAWITELALTGLITNARFSFGFYAGRVFSFTTSIVVLSVLIFESTRLYARLASSNQKLRRERDNKLMNIDAITSSIAHEVRQPLAAISANLGAARALLEMSPPDLHEATVSLNDAGEDVRRAADFLNGIRSLFGRGDQPRQPVNMNDIVLETLQSLRGEMQTRGIAASHDLTFDLPAVTGHKSQLQEVVLNLVNNALEAMDSAAGRSRKLEIITRRHDADEIVVAVKDTGPGIDAKQLGGIFDTFVTTKSNGMGLGLAICRAIVERHGGRLTAFSDGKSGALFQFVLPMKPSDEATDANVG